MECACCSSTFKKRQKGFNRVSLSGGFKGGASVSSTLTENYSVNFTPGKEIYVCEGCARTIKSIDVKRGALDDAEEKFRKVRRPGSYLATKLQTTPSRRGTAKRPRVFSSPLSKRGAAKEKVPLTVTRTEIGRAVQLISESKYLTGFRLLFNKSSVAKSSVIKIVCDIVRKEMVEFCRNQKRTKHSLNSLLEFDWSIYLSQANRVSPSMIHFLIACLTKKQYHKSASKKGKKGKITSFLPIVGMVVSILAQMRSRHNGVLQLMISLIMWIGGCKRKVFGSFNKLGLCYTIEATRKAIDTIRMDYDSKISRWKENLVEVQEEANALDDTMDLVALEDVWEEEPPGQEIVSEEEASGAEILSEEGSDAGEIEDNTESTDPPLTSDTGVLETSMSIPTVPASGSVAYYDITFDNINQKIGVRHHVRGKKSQMLNMVNAYATLERIGSYGLSNALPRSDDIKHIPISSILPTEDDELCLKEELAVIVGRILSTYLKTFQDVETASIPHKFLEESAHKSDIVPLGVLNKDEATTAGMIEILDNYKQYVPVDNDGNPHKFILFCDGLSCERIESAQRARVNGADIDARLEMFEPGIQEWHRRLMFIQDTYDELFKAESQRERGTLYNLKQQFDHRSVSKNVMDNFDKAEELLEFATEGYVVLLAMTKLSLDSVDDCPFEDVEEQKTRMDEVCKDIVEEIYEKPNTTEILKVAVEKGVTESIYCICKLDVGGDMVYCCNVNCKRGTWFHLECLGLENDDIDVDEWYCCSECKKEHASKRSHKNTTVDKFIDRRYEYTKRLMWRGLNDMTRHDAVKENDGPRIIRYWKFDMFDYFEKNHPKYLIFGHRLLANIAGGTSQRIRHQLIWERTVNVKGGKRKNIPKDLHCEHLNNEYKLNSRQAAGQLTENTIARHSQMLGLGKILNEVFEEQLVCKQKSYTRQHGSFDRKKDIHRMIQTLRPLRVFEVKKGRSLSGFEDFKVVRGVSHPKRFKQRLIRCLNNMVKLRSITEI